MNSEVEHVPKFAILETRTNLRKNENLFRNFEKGINSGFLNPSKPEPFLLLFSFFFFFFFLHLFLSLSLSFLPRPPSFLLLPRRQLSQLWPATHGS